MPEAAPIIKKLLSPVALPGIFMAAMGLGLVPVDDNVQQLAAPFIDPLGIPFRPFSLFLGSCNFMAGLSMWGLGPMPETVARVGLMMCSGCGAYAHYNLGETFIHSLVYFSLASSLWFLDPISKGKKD